jgi:Cu(I)/Ag(I) efflux system membrane protein CusA/SilA
MVGAVEWVRPEMMTVAAITAGLLPIMWSTGTGSEIMQRIAVPMIGGMISSTLLTLFVIPAIYGLVREKGLVSGKSTFIKRVEPVSPQNPPLRLR